MHQQSAGLRQASTEAGSQLSRVSDSISKRTHELSTGAERAAQLVALVTDALHQHSEQVTQTSESLSGQVDKLAGGLEKQYEELRTGRAS